jgi:polyisoprenoid-binding protein YceI
LCCPHPDLQESAGTAIKKEMMITGMNVFFRIGYLKAILVIFFFFIAISSMGQLHPVTEESNVHFTIHNFGFKVPGSLASPEGEIVFVPEDPAKSSFRVTIKSESIFTDNHSRDEHLKEEDYFDVKNYPLIRFVSSGVRATGKNSSYEATGTLTIKDKNKEIKLPFTAVKSGSGWLFAGSFKMNRRDFGIGGSSTISNELTVEIKVVAR